MIELQKTLDLLQKDELVKTLENAKYAFAAWRAPNSSQTQFVISLRDAERLSDFQLGNLEPGFLINEFSENHPTKPYFIPGDIIIREDELIIDPKVTASQIDQLNEAIGEGLNRTLSQTESLQNSNALDFEAAVEEAVNQIKQGSFEKVVLSRFKDQELPEGFSAWDFFQRIAAKYSNAFISLTFVPGKGLWIGATPELLLSNDTSQFKTVSLAGTKTLEGDRNLSEIAWTQKEIEEQAFVGRYIINCFKKIRLREFHEHGPKTIKAGNLAHLKTEFIVDYNEITFDNLADQMLELLHPTSAVCGMPIESTKPWIRQIEDYDREFYSGFLGPVNFSGSTELYVNLRCMKVEGNMARFFAGAGITEDSMPEKELLETEMKMNVLMSMLN